MITVFDEDNWSDAFLVSEKRLLLAMESSVGGPEQLLTARLGTIFSDEHSDTIESSPMRSSEMRDDSASIAVYRLREASWCCCKR